MFTAIAHDPNGIGPIIDRSLSRCSDFPARREITTQQPWQEFVWLIRRWVVDCVAGLQHNQKNATMTIDLSRRRPQVRNIKLAGRRTSLRLEPEFWDALDEIVARESSTLSALCERIKGRRTAANLTAAVRLYVLRYFRSAATETGHRNAGHGRPSTRSSRAMAL
jgi:predicted DNA-binding ribbon-helix-helix protein